MKIKEVSVSRKFSLGNYNMLDLGMVATLEDGEDEKETIKLLNKKILETKELLTI